MTHESIAYKSEMIDDCIGVVKGLTLAGAFHLNSMMCPCLFVQMSGIESFDIKTVDK